MKTYLVITALLLSCFLLTSCGEADTPGRQPVATADLPSVTERWKGMTDEERAAVCQQASQAPSPEEADSGSGQIPETGPDYKGMLNALIEAGFDQPEAAAMLPYVANQCL